MNKTRWRRLLSLSQIGYLARVEAADAAAGIMPGTISGVTYQSDGYRKMFHDKMVAASNPHTGTETCMSCTCNEQCYVSICFTPSTVWI